MPDDARVQQLLDELLDSGATPEQVCSSDIELLPQVRDRWRQMRAAQAELDALFPPAQQPGAEPSTVPPTNETLPPTPALPTVPGYEIEAMLGQGGMGVVYRARHLRLNRVVALKMALAGAYTGREDQIRFQREAEAVAALRHPNVVQIYDVGDVDGRPYFTMEFVEGGSLSDKMLRIPQPARQAAALVASIAEAVHAAHQHGIVHRDLKPGNILLTADGTPKLSDFGLARQLEGSAGLTRTGVLIGTPCYMAPEQAEGKARDVGPAADIYALGAIFYELLTGRPPFCGETASDTLRQVVNVEPVPPSRLNAAVPRDAETICLKCLQKAAHHRYGAAAALIDDLRRFGVGQPIQARPVGWGERVWRWGRRKPAVAAMLGTLVALLAVVGTGGLLLYQHQLATSDRLAKVDREVHGNLEWARGLLDEGWRAHDLTRLTAVSAEAKRLADVARSGGASSVVRQEAEAYQNEAADRLEHAKRNQNLLESIVDVLDPQETQAYERGGDNRGLVPAGPDIDAQYVAAFRIWGLDVDNLTETAVAERIRQEPEVVVQEIIAGLDAWSANRRFLGRPEAEWQKLSRLADHLDRSDQRSRLRALLGKDSLPRPEDIAGFLGAGSPWPRLWELTHGRTWRQLQEVRRTLNPRTEPVPTVMLLTLMLLEVGDVAGAEEVLQTALTARPSQAPLLHAMGKLLEQRYSGRLEEAIGYYRAARGQRPRLGIALSSALGRVGRAKQGEEVLRDLAEQQPDDSAIHFYLGFYLWSEQKYPEAEAACLRAIELKPTFAEAHCNLGSVLQAQKRYVEAEASCRRAIDLKPTLIEAHNNLGIALHAQGRYDEAVACYHNAIDLKPDVAEVWINLGKSLDSQGKPGESESAYRKAISLNPDFARWYFILGTFLQEQGRHLEAKRAFNRATDLKPDYAEAYCNLALLLNQMREYEKAESLCRHAIKLNPNLVEAHNNLANALNAQRRYAEAEAASRRAIEIQPDFALAYDSLGTALDMQKKRSEALVAYGRAIDLKPDFAEAYFNLGNVQFRQQKYAGAVESYRKAIEHKPHYAQAYNNLGMALGLQNQHVEAEVAFRKAIEIAPGFLNAQINLGSALLGLGKPADAESAFRQAINFQPNNGLAHHKLGIALMRQTKFEKAIASLRKGAELVPTNHPQQNQARQLQEQCQRFAALDVKLAVILQGTERLTKPSEQIEFAQLCGMKKLYAAAASFYRDALRAEPNLAELGPADSRYAGACCAVLAGCRQGKDTAGLTDQECASWRHQALDWLRKDLDSLKKELETGDRQAFGPVQQRLSQWQTDPDLAGVRDKVYLTALPDDEREQWSKHWSDCKELLERFTSHESR
jgi:serine/threonine-protein kinase